jgi:hypothetical protein
VIGSILAKCSKIDLVNGYGPAFMANHRQLNEREGSIAFFSPAVPRHRHFSFDLLTNMLRSIVVLLSPALCASSLLIGAESRATHAPVFVPLALPPGVTDCVALDDENACAAHGCRWRHSTTSAASSCYPEDSDPSTKLPLDASVDREQFAIRNASVADALFTAWKRFHGKQYRSTLEESERRAVFERHAEMVAAHNAQKATTFTMELNQFADLTWYVS